MYYTKSYAKRTLRNKIKQKIEQCFFLVFFLAGIIAVLNIGVNWLGTRDWFVPKTVLIENKSVSGVSNSNLDEAVPVSDINPDITTLAVVKESEEPRPSSSPAGLIVEKIMMLESSGGKNNYSKCEAIGKYNRYGYGIPGNGTYRCFEKDKDTEAVKEWFEEKLNEMDIATATCYYNTGTKTQDCPYYQNFINI